MKKYNFVAIAMVVLICVTSVFAISTGSILANWYYFPLSEPETVQNQAQPEIGEFYYKPEEVLPGGGVVPEIGKNHLDLLQLILYENDKGYGLNINKKPVVHNYLNKVGDIIYCDQNVSGGHLKFMLDKNATVNKLFFCITYVSETEYIAYTFSYSEMMSAILYETKIVVYKTTLRKENGVWDDVLSAGGYATVESVSLADCGRSIDVDSWHIGKLPEQA